MGKLRSIAKLSLSDHAAFVEAVLAMGWARILISFVPMRHWQEQVGIGDQKTAVPTDEAALASLGRVTSAIKRVGRNSPVEFVCLPQALAARWMLRRRDIDADLFIGTHRYCKAGEPHKLHAWLKVGERWITGHCNESDYAIFSRKSALR